MHELSLSDAVYVAVAYSDIFSYPLTIDEVIRFLPFRGEVQHNQITRSLAFLRLPYRAGFVSLQQKSRFVDLRKKRAEIAKNKWRIVFQTIWLFQFIPTIKLVAVTGALSMNNVDKGDDIDLLIVSDRKSVWITRFVLTILFDILGIRRKPESRQVSNLFCLNMFLSSDALMVPKGKRNFYIAHEIVQMVPVYDREHTYAEFCQKNAWVKQMLPHAWDRQARSALTHSKISHHKNNNWVLFFRWCLCQFDYLLMRCQMMYMKSRRTREVVERESIQFHPVDANVWVYQKLAVRLRRKQILLDKIFFSE